MYIYYHMRTQVCTWYGFSRFTTAEIREASSLGMCTTLDVESLPRKRKALYFFFSSGSNHRATLAAGNKCLRSVVHPRLLSLP
jgi:hypothetical protein